MTVITIAARKGGVGKTLLTASLSVLAAMTSEDPGDEDLPDHRGVAIIDMDPQGTLTAWRNSREAPYPAIVQARSAVLSLTARSLRDDRFHTVFIDSPPGHGDLVVQTMLAADLVLIPVKAGELDLQATMDTIAIAQRLGRPYLVLPNDATFRSIAMGQTIRALNEASIPTVAAVHHRVDAILARGGTATERSPRSRAAAELATAWDQIRSEMRIIPRRR
jgi:chromosome partitioning protein